MVNRARRVRVVVAGCGALLCAAAAAAAAADIPLAACDASSHQTILHASGERFEARAVWLDRRLAKWPGIDAAGVFKLYFSAIGSINARPGAVVTGADGALTLDAVTDAVPARFQYVAAGAVVAVRAADLPRLPALHRQQLILVREGADGKVLAATRVQSAGALDDLFAAAGTAQLGVSVGERRTAFTLWAPTAQRVAVCTYDSGSSRAAAIAPMRRDPRSGTWSAAAQADLSGKYYTYLVDVAVDGAGIVRNLVTDPYSVSLTTDSKRSYIADLDSPALKPRGWNRSAAPNAVKAQTDMVVYELHVRDFSINDATVSAPSRGKYGAFGEAGSNGMRHLAALARAGLTDVHLLPVYDIGSVPESGCRAESVAGKPDGMEQQALVMRKADADCFNWGYDPFHYNAPEGSYASDPHDGARRIVETREMVMNLHRIGLRVGMDVVYNHTFRSGQDEKSVLDRIVPGYYHRLNDVGVVERSTCCDNTATENRMMGKLMIDSAVLWTKHYRIDSFRFDLMGHQPRAVMEQLQRQVDRAAGRHVQLIGEGWNFGEVADGKRFVQASQLSLNGSGIGTFSDRARDAVRGGAASDAGDKLFKLQGYINGLVFDPNALADTRPSADLLRASDMVKVGLAGSVRSYPLVTHDGATRRLEDIDYNGQSAGYASEPAEAVNYIENHDNQTLYDINVFKLPLATSSADRARVQMLGAAINAFSQGVAYFHAGVDTLRSKSLDRNSFNSGDWFNRVDWSYQDNYFGTGAPPAGDNGADYAWILPLLANPALKPAPADIAFARDVFRDLLAIRASSSLFRLRSAADIERRLRFHNTGPGQVPTVIAAHLDGKGYPGAAFQDICYFINVDKVAHTITVDAEKAKRYRLHPAHRADPRAKSATYDSAAGVFTIPARTAVVFVQ
ncbi:alpha-1,6-glucosidase [Massilia eurypsychrophila]|uniref:Alpha-1,6-glucosidase n=1 Tax=Massilia eurypsychrophila TaxID=1485217 RepID=A0A2G8T8N5_9BURK|nr:alpha-1,6-glucosidase domain-containing protein [Massilia eurypsychrophila]PIL42417.1 alpha-1,6-glucosidase [Massilia eurypsychrophila]